MEEPLPLKILAAQHSLGREGPLEVILSNCLLRAGPVSPDYSEHSSAGL